MDHGTTLFLGAVDGLADDDFDQPTSLPGWTRKHLIAHVHYNAEALRRVVSWARTGVESRMYAGPEQRAVEIEQGAAQPASELRVRVLESATALASDLDALTDKAWSSPVVTAQGRTVAAAEIPWMRAREVAVHAVDLASGVGFADLPEGFNAALALDVVTKRTANGEAAALAEWLTGRNPEAPVLGRWL
jgi:maleylpyruvate isomerase